MASTRKVSPGGNAGSASRTHGSSLRELGAPLDQERAASMADEGGAAGAETDALQQTRALSTTKKVGALAARAERMELRSILPWAVLVGGVALAVWAWRRSHYWG